MDCFSRDSPRDRLCSGADEASVTSVPSLKSLNALESTASNRFQELESALWQRAVALEKGLDAKIKTGIGAEFLAASSHVSSSAVVAEVSQKMKTLEERVDAKIKAGIGQELQRLGLSQTSNLSENANVLMDSTSGSNGEVRGVANITAGPPRVNIGTDVRDVEKRVALLEKKLCEIRKVTGNNLEPGADLSEIRLEEGPLDSKCQTKIAEESLEEGVEKPPDLVVSVGRKEDHLQYIAKLQDAHADLHDTVREIEKTQKQLEGIHADLYARLPPKVVIAKLDDFNYDVECCYDREFDQSIWDGMMFCGVPAIGLTHSLFIVLGFLATMITQGTFCAAILFGGVQGSAFLSDQYPSLQSVRAWRIHSGHNIALLDDLSGKALVHRVCHGDSSLPYSGTYQTLRQDLNSYLSDSIGVFLCTAALFVWALTILQSFTPVLSGLCSVLYMQHHSHTQLGKGETSGNFKMASISRRRAVIMICLQLSRGAVVMITGVTGGMWLANTKNLANLILNASALSLIYSVDQLAYFVFLPKKLQSFIEHAEPLKLPDKAFGGVLYTMANVLAAITFTALFVIFSVLPDQSDLMEKEKALCGGNLDFVYTRHAPTDTLYAATTRGTAHMLGNDFDDSITALMAPQQRDSLDSATVAITPDQGKATLVHSENMQDYAAAYMSYNPFCADTTVDNFQTYTLQQITRAGEGSKCPDWKDHCGHPNLKLLRLICPVTCGCADPRAGLMYRVLSEGCPIALCQETSVYTGVLNNVTCTDPNPEELRAMVEWRRYFEHLTNYSWLDRRQEVLQVVQSMLDKGCAGIPDAKKQSLHFDFCESTEASASRPGMASLRALCPITCGCPQLHPWSNHDCPTTCYDEGTTNYTELYKRVRHSRPP